MHDKFNLKDWPMKSKTYYYKFNHYDTCFFAMILAFGISLKYSCPVTWGVFVVAALVWGYKNILRQKAVIITEKDIKIDHSKPLPWKDVIGAEIKTVLLCGKKRKILSLIPKNNIKYAYNFLQKHNCTFGPFPIPLYGILTLRDEQNIVKDVKKYIKVSKKLKGTN